MEFFLNEILEDQAVRDLMIADPEGLKEQAKALADQFAQTGDCEVPEGGMLPLFVYAYALNNALALHEKRGIPHEISVAIFKDVNLWIGNHIVQFGTPGIKVFSWLKFHLRGELYRLGRLQFRPVKTNRAPEGEWVFETHVPQGEPLDEQACLDSFARAKPFFAQYFPEVDAKYFDCNSWLLNPNHAYVMGENSNVVKFMRLWELRSINCKGKSSGTITRVFGFGATREDLPNLPEKTTMQRKVKAFLLAGGDLSDTYGVRRVDESL
ncbi:MAG: DUF5596 domain-containing protein [Clostridia bacterium]|nr:DUF5596 domain-containing protein [Clostridia bacterium]